MINGASAIRGRLFSATMIGAMTSSQNGERANNRPLTTPRHDDTTKAISASDTVIHTSVSSSPLAIRRHSSSTTRYGLLTHNGSIKPAETAPCHTARAPTHTAVRAMTTFCRKESPWDEASASVSAANSEPEAAGSTLLIGRWRSVSGRRHGFLRHQIGRDDLVVRDRCGEQIRCLEKGFHMLDLCRRRDWVKYLPIFLDVPAQQGWIDTVHVIDRDLQNLVGLGGVVDHRFGVGYRRDHSAGLVGMILQIRAGRPHPVIRVIAEHFGALAGLH